MYYLRNSLKLLYAYWNFSNVFQRLLLIVGVWVLAMLLVYTPESLGLALVGVCAALIANSTAAGGGVLFVPVFSYMELSAATVVSTSIIIQCFGMSSGSIRWTLRLKDRYELYQTHIDNLKRYTLVTVLGVFFGIYLEQLVSVNFEILFSALSATFAILLLIQAHLSLSGRRLFVLSEATSRVVVSIVAFGGAALTPFISVGVGELVAISLMLLGHKTSVAVATGVCLAAISLLTCMPFEIVNGDFDRRILIAVAPGAILGGVLAYKITEYLGPIRLKLFFSVYALLVAVVMFNK